MTGTLHRNLDVFHYCTATVNPEQRIPNAANFLVLQTAFHCLENLNLNHLSFVPYELDAGNTDNHYNLLSFSYASQYGTLPAGRQINIVNSPNQADLNDASDSWENGAPGTPRYQNMLSHGDFATVRVSTI